MTVYHCQRCATYHPRHHSACPFCGGRLWVGWFDYKTGRFDRADGA
jgi:RNA polymerase subunit RPABC4/transcription elongation factor Spt4